MSLTTNNSTSNLYIRPEVDHFQRVVSAKVLTKEWISGTYKIPQDSLIFVEIPAARAIKFSFPRPRIQGDLGETDMYSGQQYAPLLELQIS